MAFQNDPRIVAEFRRLNATGLRAAQERAELEARKKRLLALLAHRASDNSKVVD